MTTTVLVQTGYSLLSNFCEYNNLNIYLCHFMLVIYQALVVKPHKQVNHILIIIVIINPINAWESFKISFKLIDSKS